MRKTLFPIIFLLGMSTLFAQEEIETLINGSIKVTGFQVGSSLKMTTAKGIPSGIYEWRSSYDFKPSSNIGNKCFS